MTDDIMNDGMSQRDSISSIVEGYENEVVALSAKRENIVVVRCDGIGFSKWTKSFKNPFNKSFKDAMAYTTKKVFNRLGAKLAYSASDEITFFLINDGDNAEHYGGGRYSKIVSHAAAFATAAFNEAIKTFIPEKDGESQAFDARAWEVDSIDKAALCLLARQRSCVRNSVFMLARSNYSHNSIQNLTVGDLLQKMGNDNIIWEDLPSWAKRGFFVLKKKEMMKVSEDSINTLPEKHHLRKDPNAIIVRSEISEVDSTSYISNANCIRIINESVNNRRNI